MHTVTAEFDILPGKEAEAEDTIRKLVEAVQASEPGCLSYIWHRGTKEPNHVLVFEIYKDDEAVAAHRSSPHLAEFQQAFPQLFDLASVKINRYSRLAAVER
jgi:(4S)-4-hydroxy-5-phosphonooxypentane-2,3-dione isomerase